MNGSLYNDNSIADISAIFRELLSPYLGTFKNGQTAIWVEPPESPIPGTGLHCYISRFPYQVSGSVFNWRVTLTQYDKSVSGINTLDDAIIAVRKRFPANRRDLMQPLFKENEYPRAIFDLRFNREAYTIF